MPRKNQIKRSKQEPVISDDPFINEHGRPNKSALKREHVAQQELIENILNIPRSRLSDIALSERLRDELDQARQMKMGGALKRQIRLIVKLADPEEIDGMRNVLDRLNQGKAENVALQHKAERLREKLIEEGPGCDPNLAAALDGDEPGSFNRLLRDACSNVPNNQKLHAYRAIYKVIYRALEEDSIGVS